MSELGTYLREFREKRGVTQLDVSKSLGYSTPQFVSLFERGLSKIPEGSLSEIAKAYGAPLSKVARIYFDAEINKLEKKFKRYFK